MNLKKDYRMYLYIGIGLLIVYLIYKIAGGFVWFLIQTAIYVVLFLILLIFLKNRPHGLLLFMEVLEC